MFCYLCHASNLKPRSGIVRDRPSLLVLECQNCGLVQLSSKAHIEEGHYENSGMHGDKPIPMKTWLAESARDDLRRFEMMKNQLLQKRLLDFGCGAGGFLQKARTVAAEVVGVEPELRVREFWKGRFQILPNLSALEKKFDLVTLFHVAEHLPDPRETLRRLAKQLLPDGQMIVEVPSSNDALLTLYDCNAFKNFTYWSQHLHLFNCKTLSLLAKQAGFRVSEIRQIQRYSLSNHLHWLSQGKPGGHQTWAFLDSSASEQAYESALAGVGMTDTLVAFLQKE